MSIMRMPTAAAMRQELRTNQSPLTLGEVRVITDEEVRNAVRRGRQLQAQAMVAFFRGIAKCLKSSAGSRAQRVSNALIAAGR